MIFTMDKYWIYEHRSIESLEKFNNVIKMKENKLETTNELQCRWVELSSLKKTNKDNLKHAQDEFSCINKSITSEDIAHNNVRSDTVDKHECVPKEILKQSQHVAKTTEELIEQIQEECKMDESSVITKNIDFNLIYEQLCDSLDQQSICNICTAFCCLQAAAIDKYSISFCTNFLCPLFKNIQINRQLENSLFECINKFGEEICRYTLIPLMRNETPVFLINVSLIRKLSLPHKSIILKEYLNGFHECEPWILSIIYLLYIDLRDSKSFLELIIDFLTAGCKKHSKNTHFAKLLHAVSQDITQRNDDVSPEIREKLLIVIEDNRTAFKRICIQLLRYSRKRKRRMRKKNYKRRQKKSKRKHKTNLRMRQDIERVLSNERWFKNVHETIGNNKVDPEMIAAALQRLSWWRECSTIREIAVQIIKMFPGTGKIEDVAGELELKMDCACKTGWATEIDIGGRILYTTTRIKLNARMYSPAKKTAFFICLLNQGKHIEVDKESGSEIDIFEPDDEYHVT